MLSGFFDNIIGTETKFDDYSWRRSFSIPYWLDKNKNGGGHVIYIKDNKPTKMLKKYNLSEDIKTVFIELNFWKCK